MNFWDNIWKMNKYSLCSNKMKLVNVQILRYILPTNYTVNECNANQDLGCSFCTVLFRWSGGTWWVKLKIWNLIHMKMSFKFAKYVLSLCSQPIYEKISLIYPWITWYIRATICFAFKKVELNLYTWWPTKSTHFLNVNILDP